ncbi:MAG: hemerythrin domain-containing protein [Prevotellaceae bacterium]|jgi:regulator of cell morphogenesis and NO signaling|nr:hemerythrin domain-containing protein [Prevotellaceae bacterium]
MMLITTKTKLADAICYNYLLIPLINRFGIRLGFGDKDVETVCKEHGIDADFFTTILNTFTFENYFSEKKLKSFSIPQWIDYLRKTHVYYREVQLPIIENHLNFLIKSIGNDDNKNMEPIGKFFAKYKQELLAHLTREDEETFPYIERLLALKDKPNSKEIYEERSKEYSIKVFEREHDNVDEKLFDLKNILIKYLSGNYDQSLCNTVIFELSRLENDLKDHTRLENKILIPMVEELEKTIKSS